MKHVIVIDKELPTGLIANTAAVLGLSLGSRVNGLVGPDIFDKDNQNHIGISQITIPVLGTTKEQLKTIKDKISNEEFADIFAIDFCSVAQKSKNYDDYTNLLYQLRAHEIEYLGLCLCGPVKKINKLTGNIGLL